MSRRDVLRAMGAVGAAAALPIGLGACEPGTTPQPLAPDPSVRGLGFVGGTDVVIGQGGWCWFQSPRASFGPGGLLWLGTTISNSGQPDNGAIMLTALDTVTNQVRSRRQLVIGRQDDHTSPSVLALGNRVQVAWGLHQPVDYLELGETAVGQVLVTQRVHRPASVQSPGRGMSYASAHVVRGERWILYRGEQFSWNLLTSPDGKKWTARGLVIKPGVVGQRPYLSAASDGTRLHLILTDGNPTEYPGTSVYAGSIGSDRTITNSSGTVIGSVGSGAPVPAAYTRLLAGDKKGGGPTPEVDDIDGWTCDLRIVDGRPTGIISQRDPWPNGSTPVGNYRHRYLWVRQRPTGWVVEHLCWAGGELYDKQPDYTGLGTQDPSDPKRVVVSTNVHPVSGEPLVSAADAKVHWELFQGYRVAEGQWSWTPLTANSTEDNIRPLIAAGGAAKSLAWMRGTYFSWTAFNTRMVVRNAIAPPP